MIYLDNNATTEPLPEVREAVLAALRLGPSNPSSPHAAGEPARRLLAAAREHVAQLIRASPEQVLFTSSGTEANNMAMHSVASHRSQSSLVTTPIEHESIRRKAEMLKADGTAVDELPVDSAGRVLLDAADEMIRPGVDLVSVQWVNSETGIIQPIEQIAAMCRSKGVRFHTDAAQAVGKVPVDVNVLEPDFLTFTGHKFHAPMGTGVLYFRQGAPLQPLFGGGTQELGLRPGSQNLSGIAGLGTACRIRADRQIDVVKRMVELRNTFEAKVIETCKGAHVNTPPDADRVCSTTNIRFPGVDGEALLAQLITHEVCCSQGSACTAQIPEPSHTLMAMGLTPDEAFQSIRFSFSELNTMNEVKGAVEIIAACYARLRRVFGGMSTVIGSGEII